MLFRIVIRLIIIEIFIINLEYNLQIVDTDYETYLIAYICGQMYDRIKHFSRDLDITSEGSEAMRRATGDLELYKVQFTICNVSP